eukprot:scaffold30.g4455.t1
MDCCRAQGSNGTHLDTTHVGNSTNIRWHDSTVRREDKELLLGQRGCVLWFTGLSASGKSTVACTLEHILSERGHFTILLDGDNIRHGLNRNLGFRRGAARGAGVGGGREGASEEGRRAEGGSIGGGETSRGREHRRREDKQREGASEEGRQAKAGGGSIRGVRGDGQGQGRLKSGVGPRRALVAAVRASARPSSRRARPDAPPSATCPPRPTRSAEDRAENIRRIGEVAKIMAESGVVALTSFISPYASDRDAVRARLAAGDFLEIYMKVPLELCEARDPKGLYKKARAGEIKNFTGIDDPYEPPAAPEVTLEPYRADGSQRSPEEMAEAILAYLDANGYLRYRHSGRCTFQWCTQAPSMAYRPSQRLAEPWDELVTEDLQELQIGVQGAQLVAQDGAQPLAHDGGGAGAALGRPSWRQVVHRGAEVEGGARAAIASTRSSSSRRRRASRGGAPVAIQCRASSLGTVTEEGAGSQEGSSMDQLEHAIRCLWTAPDSSPCVQQQLGGAARQLGSAAAAARGRPCCSNTAIEVLRQRLPNLWRQLGRALQSDDTLLRHDIGARLDVLEGYGFTGLQLQDIFEDVTRIRLLNNAPQTLLDRLAYMEGLLQGDHSVVIRACNQASLFLCVSQNTLERNNQYCLSLGMSAEEIADLVRERPSAFAFDLTTPYRREVIRSFGRLFGETPLEFMQKHPTYAARDLSRIECRVAFLHEQGHGAAACNGWVSWPDTRFIKQLGLDAAAYQRHCAEWEGSERALELQRLRAEVRRREREATENEPKLEPEE